MSDYENQRIDPTTGLRWKQKIAGVTREKEGLTVTREKVGPTVPKCVGCGNTAKAGKKHCRNCAAKPTSKKAVREEKKAADEKVKAKKWGKSETSTISIRGVRKNRWRSTYNGPRFLPENYLLEERGENKP